MAIAEDCTTNDNSTRSTKFRVVDSSLTSTLSPATSLVEFSRLQELEDNAKSAMTIGQEVEQESGLLTELAALEQGENVDNVSLKFFFGYTYSTLNL